MSVNTSIITLISLCLWLTCSKSLAEQKPLIIATLEYPPYSGQQLPHNGYINHIVSNAFERVDIEFQFVFVPWSRALFGAEKGDYDAVSFASYSEQRTHTFIHSEPFEKENVVFVANKTVVPQQWSELSDLAQFRFGATRHYTYTKSFWEFVNSARHPTAIVNKDIQNFLMLSMGRIDLFPIDESVLRYFLEDVFEEAAPTNLQILTPPLSVINFHLLFSRKNPNARTMANKFNLAMTELKSSGRSLYLKNQFANGYYTAQPTGPIP